MRRLPAAVNLPTGPSPRVHPYSGNQRPWSDNQKTQGYLYDEIIAEYKEAFTGELALDTRTNAVLQDSSEWSDASSRANENDRLRGETIPGRSYFPM